MKIRKLAALVLMGALALTGCNSNPTPSGVDASESATTESQDAPAAGQTQEELPAAEQSSGIIKVAGSTSVAPLMKELKAAYEGAHPGTSVEIQESGSSAGITATIEGAADLGMSSRDLKDEEAGQGLEAFEIALDGIAVVVNAGNPVTGLTQEQIAAIYRGEIGNWQEVGGDDAQIIVVSREEGSGTRGAFEELLGIEGEVTADGIFENSTGGVKSNVSTSKNAIGYISLGSLDDTVAAIDVDGVACGVDTVKDKSYAIARPFLVCTLGAPGGDTQQLIDFILSEEGQSIVIENSYISVD